MSILYEEDNTVWVWGEAGYGTKSANGFINSPVKVKELSNVKSIAAGERHFSALKSDGTVWTWGFADEAILGYSPSSTVPRQVPNIKSIIALSSDSSHTIALKKDGSVYVWGSDNYIDQNFNGYISSGIQKYQVKDLNNVCKVFAGDDVSFAIKNDGTVWAWGDNQYGQLGDGSAQNKGLPVKVNTINKVIQISNDYGHTVFLRSDGTIWFCGYKCNLDTQYYIKDPVAVKTLKDVKIVAASNFISAALKNDGTVCVWGDNILSNLEKSGVNILLPKVVKGLDNVKSIQTGELFITALKFDGSVWAWGDNSWGQLGDSRLLKQSSPVKVPVLESIKTISSGLNYTLALKNDGTVWGFGADELYEIDHPIKENISTPQVIKGLKDIKKVDGGTQYAMALGNDGSLWCWRYFGFAIGGGGILTEREIPKRIEGIKDIVDIENGAILKKDGTIWVFNNYLKLEKISGITGIKAIFKNDYYSIYAVDRNNIVWSINFSSSIKNEKIKLDYKIIKNIESRLALKNDGTVLAWGNNEYGQAGNGDCGSFPVPILLK